MDFKKLFQFKNVFGYLDKQNNITDKLFNTPYGRAGIIFLILFGFIGFHALWALVFAVFVEGVFLYYEQKDNQPVKTASTSSGSSASVTDGSPDSSRVSTSTNCSSYSYSGNCDSGGDGGGE